MSKPHVRTPFPWNAWGSSIMAGGDRHKGIDPYTVASRINNRANMALLAASPKLYAACNMALISIPVDEAHGELAEMLRAAIREADNA